MAHICILLPCHWGAARGGAEFQSHLLAEYLIDNSDHTVTFLANRPPERTEDYRYHVRRFGGPRLPGGLRWGRLPDTLDLLNTLKEVRPQVIVQMVASAYTGVAAWYAQRTGSHLYWYIASDMDIAPSPVVGVHGLAEVIDRNMFIYGLRHANYIIAQTHSQSDVLHRNFGRHADLTIPNFLPYAELNQSKQAGFTVSWIANIKKLKRPELFVDLARACRETPEIFFRMAGRVADDQLALVIDQATRELPNFQYLGELSLDGVEAELDKADVFVNTSDYEGFPNTFIQAWLHAVPVISLNVDPDGTMARHGIGIRTETMELMLDQLLELKTDRASLESMGKKAREYAIANHSLANAAKLCKHFESVLARK